MIIIDRSFDLITDHRDGSSFPSDIDTDGVEEPSSASPEANDDAALLRRNGEGRATSRLAAAAVRPVCPAGVGVEGEGSDDRLNHIPEMPKCALHRSYLFIIRQLDLHANILIRLHRY